MTFPIRDLRIRAMLNEASRTHGEDYSYLKFEVMEVHTGLHPERFREYVGQTFEFELADQDHYDYCAAHKKKQLDIDPDFLRELAVLKVSMVFMVILTVAMCVTCGLTMLVVLR